MRARHVARHLLLPAVLPIPLQRCAAALQQPPYAGQVAAAYAKKIEAIARQPAWWVG